MRFVTEVVGCVGTLVVATRGEDGAGEVMLTVRGSKEAYLAWSVEPLPKGAKVLVIDVRGARTVVVEPWHDPVLFEARPD
jgi:membrane protein implicated in regulation of membrane protease activity